MRQTLRITATALALFACAGTASAMTSGAMPASEPIDGSTVLHNGIRTSVPMRMSEAGSGKRDLILTAGQQKRIWRWLAARRSERKPVGFQSKIGGDVPQAVMLHRFPYKLAGYIPAIAAMQYAKVGSKLLVVRRGDREIESVIGSPSAPS